MSVATLSRHAWRSLSRAPVFLITASLTLVIGIGAAVAIFAVVNGVLLRPLPYGDPDRLVGAWHNLPPLNMKHIEQTAGTYTTYKRFSRAIDGIALYQQGSMNVSDPGGGSDPQRLSTGFISASLVPVLQMPPLLGRPFTEEEDLPKGPEVMLISEGLWRSRFAADPGVIGRSLEVNGLTRQIVGVMPERFRFPAADVRIWLPLKLDPNNPYPGGFNYSSIARLKAGVTVPDAQRDFKAVLPRIVEVAPNLAPGVTTQMLLDQAKPEPLLVPLREDMTGGIARTLWMIAAAAGLVLLVACANVTNLILVRADGRQRELAVREALGAGRARVMLHFLTDSAVVTGIAAVLGLGAAWLSIRSLVSAGPAGIPRLAEVRIDTATVLFTFVVAGVVAVVCSVIPALRIGRARLSNALREGGRSGTAGRAQQRVRGALVAAQIALCLVVLAGSGLLVRTFQQLSAVRPGFNPEGLATFWLALPGARYKTDTASVQFYTRLRDRVAALPGVEMVGLTSRLPLTSRGMNLNPFYAEDDPSSAQKIPPLAIFTTTDGEYFRTMGIPLIAGRTFERMDQQREGEVIISLRAAQHFWKDSTGRTALGKRFRGLPSGPWHTIVGVVGDARDTALAAPPSMTVYFPQVPAKDTLFSQTAWTMALAVRTSGDPAAMTSSVQRVVRELDATLPVFDSRPMAAVMSASMAQLSFIMIILGAAAAVTISLGAVGLYGVMAYIVTLRTKELGVRIALGAQPRAVAVMMTRQGLVLTAIGIGAGLAIFALVARFLRSFLFGVAPGDPLTLIAASIVLAGIAALASWIPARRAARVDPADALRAE